jgi:hypothetical protein
MKGCTFILLIGLAAAPAAQAQTCSPHFKPTDSCTEAAFIAKVCDMAAFDPRLFNPAIPGYTSPTCDTSDEWRAHDDLLKAVYLLAPPHVQRKLCKLDNFFVLTSRSFTWGSPLPLGIWELPARGNKVYIAIPLKVLEEAKKHKSLATQEKENLDRLLDNIIYTGARPTFQNGSPEAGTAAAAILAVVAHELGHVLLADNNADGDGGNEHKDKRPCDKPTGPVRNCFKTKFLGASLWNASRFSQRRWVDWGVRNNNKYLGGQDYEDVKIILDIQKIYDKRFVSLFAAVSPEEDFVETYKYKVLADVPTLKLTIDLALSTPPDVLEKVRNATGNLKGKIRCVTDVTQ